MIGGDGMILNKRIVLLAGHYGSGKTNVAVNLVQAMKTQHEHVAFADLDIVNPYFRGKDSSDELEQQGIRVICSDYANSNVDMPVLPPDMYAITDDKILHTVIDVGGDDRGALALGRLAPAIRAEQDYHMLMVVNGYRPLTRTPDEVLEVMREIELAGGVPFTGLINNSNIGAETTAEDVLATQALVQQVAKRCGLPVVLTTVDESLYDQLKITIPDLFPLRLQRRAV